MADGAVGLDFFVGYLKKTLWGIQFNPVTNTSVKASDFEPPPTYLPTYPFIIIINRDVDIDEDIGRYKLICRWRWDK